MMSDITGQRDRQKGKVRGSLAKLNGLALSLDQFGESASFQINGSTTYNSLGGSLMTLVILSITLSYAVQRFIVMKAYEDTNHLRIEDPFMNDEISLPHAASNFYFATGFLNQQSLELDEIDGYLEVAISQFQWSVQGEELFSKVIPLKYKKCTLDDLNNYIYEMHDPQYVEVIEIMIV